MPVLDNLLAVALSTVSGSTCTADINGVPTTVQVVRGLTVGIGDVLVVQRYGSTWVVSGRLYQTAPTTPPPPTPVPPPKPETVTGRSTFAPVETRSYRPTYGWRMDNADVYHGEWGSWGNHTGCAFYKRAPRSLDGATVTKATIQVRRPSGTGGSYAAQATRLWTISNSTRPAGAPSLITDAAGPNIAAGQTVTFTIPDSFGQALVDGTAGGLALFDSDGSPYTIFAGKGRWSPAFTLTLDWRR